MSCYQSALITLSALSVILTTLAIIVAILGFFGYRNIQKAATAAAREAAREQIGHYLDTRGSRSDNRDIVDKLDDSQE